jgi:acetolactate synthase I/III small subunit
MHIKSGPQERHTLSVTVTNEPGVLARIAGMFSARGYNIESLTVADITEDDAVSRITIVTVGTSAVIEQVVAQLDRMVPVHKVTDLTLLGDHVEREDRPVRRTDGRNRPCRSGAHRHRGYGTRQGSGLNSEIIGD